MNEPLFETIQEWAKYNMAGEWGCQMIGTDEDCISKLKTEYPHGWLVEVKSGNYWVWPDSGI